MDPGGKSRSQKDRIFSRIFQNTLLECSGKQRFIQNVLKDTDCGRMSGKRKIFPEYSETDLFRMCENVEVGEFLRKFHKAERGPW